MQRQLANDLSVSVGYVGSLAHDLPFAQDVNYPLITTTPVPSTGNVQQRRPNPGFGSVLLVQSNQTASYRGMQVTVTKRMSHHLLLNVFYTFSKNLNSLQLDNNQTQGGAQNMLLLGEDRGRADIDQRHAVSVSAVWQPEFSYGGNAVINLVGDPHTGTCPNGANVGTPSCWFNITAFARNAVVTGKPVDGNSPRNLLDQPGFKTVDLAVFRNFRVREQFGIEFRVEGTNTFNMVNLNPPNATFGQITTALPMRQLQLGLRFAF